jgi:hypothetical protein
MIAPPLLGDEIAAIHLREEGRYHIWIGAIVFTVGAMIFGN